ncbi:SDR family NAD(P)-dependent oxidoreductase [Cryobacterium tepidiphilum]|uniref:SDR family oxidoreductase n=1 Tax=Cryobacterium tepidiphilum TaxID=2486026 RepID=A0A3M8LGI4_9MICO|nr:SDR family oxidoreductase [Cryobacterium tepidiphilum]RNE63598.1 SDR family oxidoreductase [Cryobacterium tepidiphilum]
MASSVFNPIGTTALVTGASSGLGHAYAHRLAQRGADLVLVARRQERLEALAVDLAEKYGTVSTVIPTDLSQADAVATLVEDLREREVSVGTLVNNAGFATWGTFADLDPERERDEIAVNVQALTALTHAFLPGLLQQAVAAPGSAALVNIASVAAFTPMPHMAVYAATKAYVSSFTEALWHETRRTGLKVLTVCPGPVHTEFGQVARNEGLSPGGGLLTVDRVMNDTFAALDRATTPPRVVTGPESRVAAGLSTVLPRRLMAAAVGRFTSPARHPNAGL